MNYAPILFSALSRMQRGRLRVVLPDGSTIDVATAREVISVTEAHGYQMVDAPVSGGIAAAAVLYVIASGELEEVLPAHRPPAMPLHLLYAPNRQATARLRAFIDWAGELFAPAPEQLAG